MSVLRLYEHYVLCLEWNSVIGDPDYEYPEAD